MTKKELIAQVAESTNKPQTQVSSTLESIIETILTETAKGNEVQISGLGKFGTRVLSGKAPGTNKPWPVSFQDSHTISL